TYDLVSVLVHALLYCVTGLTLPPVDANPPFFFITYSACPGVWRRKFTLEVYRTNVPLLSMCYPAIPPTCPAFTFAISLTYVPFSRYTPNHQQSASRHGSPYPGTLSKLANLAFEPLSIFSTSLRNPNGSEWTGHTYNTVLEKFHNSSLRALPKYQY
ncbi:hypothetical protein N7449_005476, partial [Penicillium cf. viridicatum]